MPPSGRPIAIDLFAGAGGMSCGVEQAGFDVVLAVDHDPHHVATHARNFPYGAAHVASVAALDGATLRRLAGLGPADEVDLLFGGPPCQGFSHMGLRDAEDPRNSLVHHFVRVVAELRPRAVVIENVPGMAAGPTRPLFEHALAGLAAAGYRVLTPVRALDAQDFGVPQARRRLFVLGLRADQPGALAYPSPLPAAARATVGQAFEDLPDVDGMGDGLDHDEAPYSREPSVENVLARAARGLPGAPADHARPRPAPARPTGCARARHAPATAALYAATRPGAMVPGHKLPRLDPGGQAPTLRAGTGAERGSHTAPRPIHPHAPRVITVREAARLHGYPDWFCFYPGKWHAYRQIGNSVCPPVARAVGLALMRALGVDPARLPRPALALGPVPVVAGGGPPAPRRLQTAAEFPKVVEALWRAATARGLPPVAEITVGDVEAAIAASGAALPRVRPARFVSALLRFRRAEALLELPRAAGYTLAAGGAGRVGAWVSLAEAAARRAPAPVRSAALRGARPLHVPGGAASAGARAALAAHPEVCAALGLGALVLGAPPAGEGDGHWPAVADGAPAAVLALGHGRLPPLRALATMAARAGCAELVVISALTTVHVLAARFRCAGVEAQEVARAVFSLDTGG